MNGLSYSHSYKLHKFLMKLIALCYHWTDSKAVKILNYNEHQHHNQRENEAVVPFLILRVKDSTTTAKMQRYSQLLLPLLCKNNTLKHLYDWNCFRTRRTLTLNHRNKIVFLITNSLYIRISTGLQKYLLLISNWDRTVLKTNYPDGV